MELQQPEGGAGSTTVLLRGPSPRRAAWRLRGSLGAMHHHRGAAPLRGPRSAIFTGRSGLPVTSGGYGSFAEAMWACVRRSWLPNHPASNARTLRLRGARWQASYGEYARPSRRLDPRIRLLSGSGSDVTRERRRMIWIMPSGCGFHGHRGGVHLHSRGAVRRGGNGRTCRGCSNRHATGGRPVAAQRWRRPDSRG